MKLEEALAFQSPIVREAAVLAARQLEALGVRFALAGGLAVGAHGHVRATRDVDFLVGEEAFEHHGGGLVTFRPGVPINVRGVAIDYLTTSSLGDHLDEALDAPETSAGLPVVPVSALIYMKLVAHRLQDRADVAALIQAGLDLGEARQYLDKHAPDLVPRLERIREEAELE